jgi:hypothetical protein
MQQQQQQQQQIVDPQSTGRLPGLWQASLGTTFACDMVWHATGYLKG